MLSKNELLTAIDELEDSPPTFQNCQKMATFYTLLNSMYNSDKNEKRQEIVREVTVDNYGDSEFLRSVAGLNSDFAWEIMDELMETIQVLQPKLYLSVMRRIRGEV